jgi:hypothetical protein
VWKRDSGNEVGEPLHEGGGAGEQHALAVLDEHEADSNGRGLLGRRRAIRTAADLRRSQLPKAGFGEMALDASPAAVRRSRARAVSRRTTGQLSLSDCATSAAQIAFIVGKRSSSAPARAAAPTETEPLMGSPSETLASSS